jgi:hypothetical protein
MLEQQDRERIESTIQHLNDRLKERGWLEPDELTSYHLLGIIGKLTGEQLGEKVTRA